MPHVVLIRPGATDYDEQQRIQGTLNVPLSELGTVQVLDLAHDLEQVGLKTLYCGCGESVSVTATEIAQALHIKLKALPKLVNLNQGLWQGMTKEDVKRKHPKTYKQWRESPLTVCPPEGEMLQDAVDRVRRVLGPVLRKHKSADVIGIVVPEPLACIVYSYLSDEDLVNVWKTRSNESMWQLLPNSQ